jgi:hypothetical protein
MFSFTVLFLGISVGAAAGTDPAVGTWQLNVAKSSFTPGPALKSQTRTYAQSGQGISLVAKSVSADGKESTTRMTYQYDGKDYPVTGDPDYDGIAVKQIDANTAEAVLKKGGKTVGKTVRKVSQDGKTLTLNSSLTAASGQKIESVLVLDKQ